MAEAIQRQARGCWLTRLLSAGARCVDAGQIMEEQRKAGALAKQKGVKGSKGFPKTPAALAKQGIDKNLANSARKRANTPSRSAED